MDEEHSDVVFRQPVSRDDLQALLEAAGSDPFGGYCCDGNTRWTDADVREWWRRRDEIRAHVTGSVLRRGWFGFDSEYPDIRLSGQNWLRFLDEQAEDYLRSYCYYLDTESWPTPGASRPDL